MAELTKDTPIFGIPLKWFVLILLTVQNAGAVLIMRYTRSIEGQSEFNTQAAVIMQEVLKGIAAIGVLMKTEGSVASVWELPYEALKVSVPAILYLLQNNLQYLAVGKLDAATYSATYQTKIIWVGILSVILLGRKLSCSKWTGLFLLTIGVVLIQVGGYLADAAESTSTAYDQRYSGIVFVLSAAVCSSLAGVYFEKILKGVKISVWARNFQLAGYSVITGFIGLSMADDSAIVYERGLLYGFTNYTWACILMNAFGGLLVGNVIKYADSIQKDIAIGLSIVFSSLASVVLFDFEFNRLFVCGVGAVMYAVLLYGEKVDCCGMLRARTPLLPTKSRHGGG